MRDEQDRGFNRSQRLTLQDIVVLASEHHDRFSCSQVFDGGDRRSTVIHRNYPNNHTTHKNDSGRGNK